ncbi:hypothetical protein BK720_20020 [Bacillus thuringiensis serovar brasilensis]|uniref:hypothetical protein n=1 Tax=Bacillus cereus group TaxID=86661 RepID=UPI000A3B9D3A|nr:hypothetical protein [Bacillus thuringiensis]MCU5028572.1 hypothetical protein [Bacillus cereus]MRA71932.1 hypothetical protein [Bacillus thuringiensis]MRA91184.1 hypothetical protein [Bacillus thuringiensis]MRC53401.1 hypothetical protein [Bacillus thuringiensis]OTX29682.1 hypothetical protein BK720_20020 [Bacillus thuringiensis serovar brasilensis]
MKEFMPLFASIVTGTITLIAVLLTQRGNKKVQKDLLELQIKREEMKEKRNDLKETLEIYNRILKINGESTVIIERGSGGAPDEFDFKVYQNEVRPILYEKYHLLHDEVAMQVNGIDGIIRKCQFFEEVERIDHVECCEKYSRIIRTIKQNIYNFRKGDAL